MEQLLDYVEVSLDIKSPEEWYRVSEEHLERLGALHAFLQLGGLFKVIVPTSDTYFPGIDCLPTGFPVVWRVVSQ